MDVKIETHINNKKPDTMSLHKLILSDVREKIVSGTWPPGFRIPFETDMAKDYGCSRMTVNKALTQLARYGLLERARKSGTYVKTPQTLSAAMEITNIRKEVEDSGKEYSYRLLHDTVRLSEADDSNKLSDSSKNSIRQLECLHSANGAPFCFEERMVNIGSVPEIEDVAFDREGPGNWLQRTVPWNSAEHQIIATLATEIVAKMLEIEPGAPCLVVERRTQNDLGNVTWAKLWYAGANHRLVANFTPTG
jgi:GntR family histidine utilization transcriptional repressor